MKLPHVTIEYRDEEAAGVGKLSLSLIIGMGLHWAWIFAAMHSASDLLSHQNEDACAFMVVLSMAVMSFTLISYALFTNEIRPLFRTSGDRRRIRLIGAAIDSVGFLLAVLGICLCSGAFSWVLAILGGVATGVGSAVLLMSYGVSYSICDTAASAMQFALSCVVTCAAYACIMVINSVAYPTGIIVCVAIPWLELLCLNISSKQLVDRTEFIASTMPIYQGRFFWKMALSAISFGFLWAVLAAGALTCLLIIGVMLTQRQQANYAFRTLNPVNAFIIALVVYLTTTAGSSTLSHCLFLVSYILVEACLWISYSDMSQKFRISPFHVFGAGRGIVALGAVIATIFMLPVSPLYGWLNSTNAILPVAFVLLMLGTSAYPRDAEIVNTLKRGKACLAFLDPLDPTNKAAKVLAETEAQQGSGGQAENGPQAGVRDAETPSTEAAVTSVKPAAETPSAANDEERIGRYKRRCLALANMCLLSRRETEVLFLLAKGYNTKMIQEQLYISAGTANTHMRHVYRKLDVHSQEDLIRMVDGMEVEDEVWD